MSQPRSLVNGRYELRNILGEGGKKKVFRAHDTLLDRDVAFALLKINALDEVSWTRVEREAQAMGRLGSHPHIVTIFDLGRENSPLLEGAGQVPGRSYMVTELMGGGDLEKDMWKAPNLRFSPDRTIDIAKEVCLGLEFTHGRGIVHRDLKPGNVWLADDGTVKIGDFGIAVAWNHSRITSEGVMVGTETYMSPEQVMGGDVTPQTDLYSLGAMLYEMVTGRPPFLGHGPLAIIEQHVHASPSPPTAHNQDCPRELEALILQLLEKNPTKRPKSASHVFAELEAMPGGTSGARWSTRQAENTIKRVSSEQTLEMVASKVSSERPDQHADAAPDGSVTIQFSDNEGSSAMTGATSGARWPAMYAENTIEPVALEETIEMVASKVSSKRLDTPDRAAPDGTVTIQFSDIEGSSAMTERPGDIRAHELLRPHKSVIRQQVASHRGFEMNSVDDGLMLAFSSARRGLLCAIDLQTASQLTIMITPTSLL